MQRREQQRTLSKESSSGQTDEAANARTRQQSTSTCGQMYDDGRSFERSFEQPYRWSLKRSLEQALERPFKRPNDQLTDLHAEPLFELLINKSIVRNIFKWLSMMMYIIIDTLYQHWLVHLICTLYTNWWKNIIFYFTRKNIFSQDWFWEGNEKGKQLGFGKIIVVCLSR